MIWLQLYGPPPNFWQVEQWHRTCSAVLNLAVQLIPPQWQDPWYSPSPSGRFAGGPKRTPSLMSITQESSLQHVRKSYALEKSKLLLTSTDQHFSRTRYELVLEWDSSPGHPGSQTPGQSHGWNLCWMAPKIDSCLFCLIISERRSSDFSLHLSSLVSSWEVLYIPAFKLLIKGLPVVGFSDVVFRAMKDSKCFSKSDHVMSARYLNSTICVIVSAMVKDNQLLLWCWGRKMTKEAEKAETKQDHEFPKAQSSLYTYLHTTILFQDNSQPLRKDWVVLMIRWNRTYRGSSQRYFFPWHL